MPEVCAHAINPQTSTDTRLSEQDKITLLLHFCQESKPEFRSCLDVSHPRSGAKIKFRPGNFLNNITDRLLPSKTHEPLAEEQVEQLRSLWWFESWLKNLVDKRKIGREGDLPSLDEEAELVAAFCPHTFPRREERLTVTRDNGKTHDLFPSRVLQRVSANWHQETAAAFQERVKEWRESGSVGRFPRRRTTTKWSKIANGTKEKIGACTWFAAWYKHGVARREVAKMQKVCGKDMKVNLILKHFNVNADGTAVAKPTTSDSVLVSLENGAKSWRFYPTTFLDDVSDNWLQDNRPRVVLDDAQKTELYKLPWFKAWLQNVADSRTLRAKRKSMDGGSDAGRPSPPDTPVRECDAYTVSRSTAAV